MERLFAWVAAIAVVALVLAVGLSPPAPPEPYVVAALAVVLLAPPAYVLLRTVYGYRSRASGRVGARIRSLR